MNILNYARQLELINYSNVNENTLNEADANPETALAQVKSGKTNPQFAAQWKQLTDAITVDIDNGKTEGSVLVKHDANLGGKDMVTVNWKLEYSTVNLSVATTATATTPVVSANDKVKNAALTLFKALVGSKLSEDEDAVYNVFRDIIKTDADFKSLLEYWKSQKAGYVTLAGGYDSFEKYNKVHPSNDKTKPETYELWFWLKSLFSEDELSRVNDIILNYTKSKFTKTGMTTVA